MGFMQGIYGWVMGLMASPYAPWWLFGLAFAESSFFPVPPDALLIGMAVANPPSAFYYAAICTAGATLGGMFGYGIGYYGGRPLAVRIFKEAKVLAAEKVYGKYDVWAVGAAAFTPIPYKVFTILTGVMEASFRRFVAVSFFARGARFFIVAAVLFFYGEKVKAFLDAYFPWITLALFAGIAAGFVAVGAWSKKSRKVTSPSQNGTTPQ